MANAARVSGSSIATDGNFRRSAMSTFGKDLFKSLGEALAHAKGEGPATVHTRVTPREVSPASEPDAGGDGTRDGDEPRLVTPGTRLPE